MTGKAMASAAICGISQLVWWVMGIISAGIAIPLLAKVFQSLLPA
ncbi:hypothetical protein L248_2200 [Schleiferilactobacillus shenzhenensis LY-73]|uniref:Uncharacterized protein n=1 Tax=Schleiferilactobacillus shenzhenensis LY-73 TaxID=1231336 RepID=U4TPF6_9LACO|nr:hypothetical protein L248_2200 [Schleiferilactobacillus shenzhenensis LY-73]